MYLLKDDRLFKLKKVRNVFAYNLIEIMLDGKQKIQANTLAGNQIQAALKLGFSMDNKVDNRTALKIIRTARSTQWTPSPSAH